MKASLLPRLSTVLCISTILLSCASNTNNRIVSDTPIKTEVLGLAIGDISSVEAIEYAISKATNMTVYTENEKYGVGSYVRAIPASFVINYGGLSWTYSGVTLNGENQVVQIDLIGSYESFENAKKQYDAAIEIFAQKYGKWNAGEGINSVFWTDNTNSVGLRCEKTSAVSGNDRSFCTLSYGSIALGDELDEANKPDV